MSTLFDSLCTVCPNSCRFPQLSSPTRLWHKVGPSRSFSVLPLHERMASGKANGKPNGEDDIRAKEAAVAKTAGFVVFSGIAMSLIKALATKKQSSSPTSPSPPPPSPSLDLLSKEPKAQQGRGSQMIEIVKGDTLWGLSKRHGVSIDAIKQANGLSSDIIYAGKKLIIP